ncbi:MAG TPA: hypothetical protein VLK33_10415, partial [Terriglobales bacterium]|nr:hypothetical protein [Terriglobales bacterium]
AIALGLAFGFAFLASSYWVSKHLLENSSILFYFRHCYLPTWILAIVIGTAWWIAIAPLLHNLWTTLAAFLSGYLLYLVGCGVFSYSAKERTYAKEIGRRVIGVFPTRQTVA